MNKFRANKLGRVIGLIFFGTFLMIVLMSKNQSSSSQLQLIRFKKENACYFFPVYTNQVSSNSGLLWSSLVDLVSFPEDIKTVIVVQHGIARNGSSYCKALEKACVQKKGSQKNILIIAPHFFAKPFSNYELFYKKEITNYVVPVWREQEWSQGLCSVQGVKASSFSVYDDLLKELTNKEQFPSLQKIVFVGHSAGGQYVHRYSILNNAHEQYVQAGYEIVYIVANPSSYLYFTHERPFKNTFRPYNTIECPFYNYYKYGLEGLEDHCYCSLISNNPQKLFKRFAQRQVCYVLGMNDTDSNGLHLDNHCEAQAQGKNRFDRGTLYGEYERYLSEKWGIALNHTHCYVPDVGHDKDSIMESYCVRKNF